MDTDVETLVRLAIEQLRDGRAADALLTLERTVDPKFGSRDGLQQRAANAVLLRRNHLAAAVAAVAA